VAKCELETLKCISKKEVREKNLKSKNFEIRKRRRIRGSLCSRYGKDIEKQKTKIQKKKT
jgi:hypothetical protein